MQIQLTRVEEPFHFEVTNPDGEKVSLDASPDIGGTSKGFRPTELLLAGAAGCASIDVLFILQKQKQQVKDVNVTLDGDRQPEPPKAFTGLKFHFQVTGEVEEHKLQRAIELSLNKYCSVVQSLDKNMEIDYTYAITA